MRERERLIELILSADISLFGTDKSFAEVYADYLLEDGWIRPPCKVGDKVWLIYEGEIYNLRVQRISLTQNNSETILHFGGYPITSIMGNQFGKTVFLTKEEAEKALKERESNGL